MWKGDYLEKIINFQGSYCMQISLDVDLNETTRINNSCHAQLVKLEANKALFHSNLIESRESVAQVHSLATQFSYKEHLMPLMEFELDPSVSLVLPSEEVVCHVCQSINPKSPKVLLSKMRYHIDNHIITKTVKENDHLCSSVGSWLLNKYC